MQAQIQRSNEVQSPKSMSKAKQFACVIFAVMLSLFLVPIGAFQPTSAYADELGTKADAQIAVAAEGNAQAATASAAQDSVKGSGVETGAQGAAATSTNDSASESTTSTAGNNASTPGAAADVQDPTGASASTQGNATVDAPNAQGNAAIAGDSASVANAKATGSTNASGTADAADTQSSSNADIAAQSDVGVEVNVQGNIIISGATGLNPTTNFNEYDSSFAHGANKVCINRNAFGGYAFASLWVEPQWQAGQEAAQEAWDKIPAKQKYTPETMRIGTADENILRLTRDNYTYEEDDLNNNRTNVVFEVLNPGKTTVYVDYQFQDPDTQANYQAHLEFPVYVQDTPNAPDQIAVPSNAATVWIDDTLDPIPDYGRYAYYYQYDGSNFENKTQEFFVSASTANGNPTTYSFEEMFDVSIADESIISAVNTTERFDSNTGGLVTGPDAHTYSLNFVAKKAGTTNVTIKLKQDATKSVTVAVTVLTDHPEVNAPASFDMTMDEPQRIYVDEEATSRSDASPITIPVRAEQLGWHTSKAKPFITGITSSNEGVLSVQRISSPSYWTSFAPFELVPVSVGTANLTLTDCYGKTYNCTVTVKPNDNPNPGVTVNSVTLVRDEDGESVSKSTITMNISDTEGVKLAADIDADGDVTTNWTSSNPEIAEVVKTTNEYGDEICQVKPVRASYDELNKTMADCRITATVNGQVSDYCNIKVEPLEGLCGTDPSSPLGAATISVSKAMPADVLQELQGLSLAVSSIAAGDLPKVDDATSALENGGAKLAGVYDIHFVNKADGSEHAWNKPSHPITVKVPLTASMKELQKFGTLAFYHVDPATGQRTKMPTWIDASQQFVCFETTHFSPFVLVAEPEAQADDPNGDNGGTAKPDDKGDNGKDDKNGSDKVGASTDKKSDDDQDLSGSTLPKTGDGDYALLVIALLAAAASLALFGFSRSRTRVVPASVPAGETVFPARFSARQSKTSGADSCHSGERHKRL